MSGLKLRVLKAVRELPDDRVEVVAKLLGVE